MKKAAKFMMLALLSMVCSSKITADVGSVSIKTQTVPTLTQSNLQPPPATWNSISNNTKGAVVKLVNMQPRMYTKFTLYFDNNSSLSYALAPYGSIYYLWNTKNCIKKIRVHYGYSRGAYIGFVDQPVNFCAKKSGDKYYMYGVIFANYRITANQDWPR